MPTPARTGRSWSRARTLRALLIALAATGVLALQVDARMQQAPASRVAIELPEGYEPARLFSGFTHEALGVSLVVVEMPGQAYEELAKGLTADALAAKGVTIKGRGKLKRDDDHIYIHGEQTSAAGVYAKFFVVFREGGVTALITANVQKASIDTGQVSASEIETALATARVVEKASETKDLFTLADLGPFKPAGSFLGTTKAYTLDGLPQPPKANTGRPMLIVAPSLDRRPVSNPDEYAEQLLNGIAGHDDVTFAGRRRVSIGGLDGVEIEATARERESNAEILLYQVMLLPPEGGYWRIFGQAPLSEADRYRSEFQRIARSFALAK